MADLTASPAPAGREMNRRAAMLREVVGTRVFAADPFVLLDVGCGGGLDQAWRLFEPDLVAYGLDPQLAETARLRAEERNPRVGYHEVFVGLPAAHPFVERRDAAREREALFALDGRLSTHRARRLLGPTPAVESNNWRCTDLTTETVTLDGFARDRGIESVDFLKTDTDGRDLEVLVSFEETIESAGTLGVKVEVTYLGSDHETANSFHNIDRLLRRHGFQLWTLSVRRYSRAALPAPFVRRFLGQTTWGQADQGDAVYLRDGLSAGELSPSKLLKLACLYELFRGPDAAAEILVERRDVLAPLVHVDRMLDLLTPPLWGRRVTYPEYVAAFEADPRSFYPTPAPEPPAAR